MKQKDLLFILTSSFILTVLWIGFGLWHIHTTSTIKAPLSTQLVQIPSTFDKGTIDLIKQRTIVTPIMIFGNTATISGNTIPSPLQVVPSPIASLSAETPIGSQSGSITP